MSIDLDLSKYQLGWSDDVVLFTDDTPLAADEADELAAAGVRVRGEKVARLVGRDGVLERVELAGGAAEPRRALFLKLTQRQRSPLADMLALPVSEQHGVATGERESTPIPGDNPDALAATLRAFADAGVGHIQLVLDPITVESIAALEPMLDALDR